MENIPPFPFVNDRSDVSVYPPLLEIVTPVFPLIVIGPVMVMSAATLISVLLLWQAVDSAENVVTSVASRRRASCGGRDSWLGGRGAKNVGFDRRLVF